MKDETLVFVLDWLLDIPIDSRSLLFFDRLLPEISEEQEKKYQAMINNVKLRFWR